MQYLISVLVTLLLDLYPAIGISLVSGAASECPYTPTQPPPCGPQRHYINLIPTRATFYEGKYQQGTHKEVDVPIHKCTEFDDHIKRLVLITSVDV